MKTPDIGEWFSYNFVVCLDSIHESYMHGRMKYSGVATEQIMSDILFKKKTLQYREIYDIKI